MMAVNRGFGARFLTAPDILNMWIFSLTLLLTSPWLSWSEYQMKCLTRPSMTSLSLRCCSCCTSQAIEHWFEEKRSSIWPWHCDKSFCCSSGYYFILRTLRLTLQLNWMKLTPMTNQNKDRTIIDRWRIHLGIINIIQRISV